MTSMFDQYNKTLKREEQSIPSINDVPKQSGYVSVRTKSEPPIFSKQKMKLNLPNDISHLVVANNWLITLMSHNVLLRLYLLQPDRQDEVYLEKYLGGMKVSQIFLDPLGNHLLMSLTPKSPGFTSELLYLHRKTNKPKRIERFRDHEITAVAFNFYNQSETTTGSILLGTNKGLIFETEFSVDGEKMFNNNWKQVFDIGRGEVCPITALEFHKVPNTMRHIILVTTPERLYKFHELLKTDDKPLYLQNIFNSYLNVPEHIKDFHEIPRKQLKHSKLCFNYDQQYKFPKYFGWLTDPGIFLGEIDQSADTPQFILSNEIIPFPNDNDGSQMGYDTGNPELNANKNTIDRKKKQIYPVSFILTDFHALLLYSDHITAVSLLNYQIIYEEYFTEQYGRLLDIIKDVQNGTIYAYSSKCILRYKITNEKRNVWRMYLDKHEFDLARKYSQDNPEHFDVVLVKQAELLFEQKKYIKSAEIYSETQTSFEDVCLRFLEINEIEALMIYLNNRLHALKAKDKKQITMLVVWMVELYLTEMTKWSDVAPSTKVREIQKQFDNFMNMPRVLQCTQNNRTVIYDLMASHGDNYNLQTLTTVNKDYESVINQYINQNKFGDALSILRSQNKPDLYYKYCPILMECIPKETIHAIISQGKHLEPIKLLPTLICLENDDLHITEVIRYLEFCIHSLGCSAQSIHNYLMKLYGQYKGDKLMLYLETQGKDISLIHYDVHYALRVCREHNCNEACVFLQCLLELWCPAVELALTFNTKLAQKTASQPLDRDLRRKLWLKIAEYEIKRNDDVKQALELLKECDLLRIEDLLPYFSDFQKIDHFKEAICDALQEYNLKIQDQRKEMDESAKSADRVRNDLQTFRNRSITIGVQHQCGICNVYLLLKPFFIFPCGHKFHGDCLEKTLMTMDAELNRKLTTLKQQFSIITAQIQLNDSAITSFPNNSSSTAASAASAAAQTASQQTQIKQQNTLDKIKLDIENLIASDCLYCGEHMINSIDKPFIDDWDKVNNDWL